MKSPAFQFYPDKWQTDTRRLSWEAKGVYHELMCVVWIQNQEVCSIPNDDEFIASEIGCEIVVWQRVKAELLHPHRPILTITETNRLLIRGLLKESVKQRERREQLRQNGLLGGRPKNQKVILDKPKNNQKQSLPSLSLSLSSSSFSNKDIGADAPSTDENWIEEIKKNAAYSGIDVAREFSKMSAWCSVNKKHPSRRRFVNWLNRVEKPMALKSSVNHRLHDMIPAP